MDNNKRYIVFNETDGIVAHPTAMSLEEARTFIRDFPRRFASQGYYLTASQERIKPEEIVLQILDEDWKLVPEEPAPGHADPPS